MSFTSPRDVIEAFNGETGDITNTGLNIWIPGLFWPAYKNSTGTNFFPPSGTGVRPLNYINGPYLSYAGMPGYNYDVPEGTPVLATADGKLYKAVADPVNGAGYDFYKNSYIDHQNGLFFLVPLRPLDPRHPTGDKPNGYAQVTKGQVIGTTVGDHLHFEVRYNGFDNQNVVDPYRHGLWLSNTAHVEGLLMLLLEDDPPSPARLLAH